MFDMVLLLHAAREASTDNIIERLSGFVEQMTNTVGNEAMATLAVNTRQALDEAAAEAAQTPPRGGLFAMLLMLSKPGGTASLGLLARLGREISAGRIGGLRNNSVTKAGIAILVGPARLHFRWLDGLCS